MILDATAGNRTMWTTKSSPNIIYIDIERKLKNKPTIFCDNTQTPFLSSSFDIILFDPPHQWGSKEGYQPFYPKEYKKWAAKHKPFAFTYYGWDKYKTRLSLIKHIYRAQLEFQRILKDDGILLLKWNEMRISLRRILTIFYEWNELMRLAITDPTQTWGNKQTYWIILSKKAEKTAQQPLTNF